MNVGQLRKLLLACDDSMPLRVDQLFKEHGSSDLLSIEILHGYVVMKDHYNSESQHRVFTAYDGEQFDVPILSQRFLKHI